MSTAMDRPGYNGGGTDALAAWFTEQRRRNPSFQAPRGYEWKGDHYERDTHGVVDDLAKWGSRAAVIGSAGAGAGMGLAALGGAAGAGGAGASITGSVGLPAGLAPQMIAPGITSAMGPGTLASLGGAGGAGAAGAGAAATGGTLAALSHWAPLLGLGVAGAGALRGGGSHDVPFQDELSGLLQMQRGRMEQANPLYQAILRMAMGMLPMSARAGLAGGPPPTGQARG